MKKTENGFLLCGICANILYLNLHDLLVPGYILLAVVLWLTASAIQLAAHEMGHLLGGLLSGYRLVFFNIGPVQFSWKGNRKFSIRIGKSRGGQCVMEPGHPECCHYRRYNLGGIAANVLLAMMSGSLVLAKGHVAWLLMIDLVCIGVQKAVMNSIPAVVNGVRSDAYIVRLLSRSEDIRRDYRMYLKLYASYYRGEEIDLQDYRCSRPLDVAEEELLYYHEIQAILAEYT